jgi:hypothetical protein
MHRVPEDIAPTLDNLYHNTCETCSNLADDGEGVDYSIVFSPEAMAQAAVNIYEKEFDIKKELEPNLYFETLRIFRQASALGFSKAHFNPTGEFNRQIQHNTAVFSAFKSHRLQNDMASKLLDEKGNLKSFSTWLKEVKPLSDHYNKQWLKTEYNTAVGRAHFAGQWKQYEAQADVLPNVEWLPTISTTPGEDHRVFWHTIKPINDIFWQQHHPRDRWNCKCEMQATDKAPTDSVADNLPNSEAQAGLESNPAKGEIFSDKHPYFADSCAVCPVNGRRLNLFAFRQRKDCYACQNANELIDTTTKESKNDNRRKELVNKMERLLTRHIIMPIEKGKSINVGFNRKGNRHIVNDFLKKINGLSKNDLLKLPDYIRTSEFVKPSELYKDRADNITRFFYYYDKNKNLYYNVAKTEEKTKKGRVNKSYFLYSVTKDIP